jgi:hypothetical protein
MSNSLAIAAVTTTLRNILARGIREELGSGIVTARPPDKARDSGDNSNQVNLFLYHTLPNAAWRNTDLHHRVKPGETGNSPLAINLYYLITAYGQDNEDTISHRLLGQAMRLLHDYTILNPDDIRSALPESDLQNQIERVKITLLPLNLEDISKLWATFQTQYRISVAYEVSVLLIESNRPVKTPLPVLMRGSNDKGVIAQADLIPPFPTLEQLQLPNGQPSLRLGERLIFKGNHLNSEGNLVVRFLHPLISQPFEVITQLATDTEIVVELPDQPQDWPAGFYTTIVQVRQEGQTRTTNALSFSLAPVISRIDISGDRILTIICKPDIWPEQRVALLIGDREFLPQPDSEGEILNQKTNTLVFNIRDILSGEYFVRLRVDGVDSLLVNRSIQPPAFDFSQRVRIP